MDFAQYMVERLKQCGIKYVFGVPGEFGSGQHINEREMLRFPGDFNLEMVS